MRIGRLLIAALLFAPTVATPTRAGDATGAFAPYEDLLQVLGDLAWHLRDDVYRFPPPRDPTGHDIYRLALERITNWETRYPGRMRDVTTFARAQALERLGEYGRANGLYKQVAALPSPLAQRARDALDRSQALAEAAALPETGSDLDATLAALKTKLDAWGKLVTRYAATPYEPLALAEEERLEQRAAELIVTHRAALEDGMGSAERSLRFLIEKHADSKNLPAHVLRLADFYAQLARDYLADHDRPLAFEEDEFVRRVDRALATYRKVSTWDGAREKPEAQGRFESVDAWKTTVLARYR
jgi:hypothetical protein